jgi:hypothetical protein
MKITTVVDVKTLNSLNDDERIEAFAKINSKDLETIIHYASIELQERKLVEEDYLNNETNEFLKDDELLGTLTAEERKIWL